MIRTTIRSAHSTFTSFYVHTDSGFPTHGCFPWENIRELSFGEGGKQIDFIALSMFQSVDDVKIALDLTFSSDDFPLTITYSNHNRKSQLSSANHHRQQNHRARKTRLPLIRNWQPQLNSFIANMLRQSSVSVNFGNVRTEKVRLDRGVPQGAPESPFLFILVTEMALASLHDSWAERGLGTSLTVSGCPKWHMHTMWCCWP